MTRGRKKERKKERETPSDGNRTIRIRGGKEKNISGRKNYSGKTTYWKRLWDAFKSAIHSNKQLHDVDKFNYLKAQLKGTASEVISGLELTQ